MPKLVERLEGQSIRLIGCGAKHTVAVSGDGKLYLWGRGEFPKLGKEKRDAHLEPFEVQALVRKEFSNKVSAVMLCKRFLGEILVAVISQD